MSKILFDTCAALNLQEEMFTTENEILFSSLTFVELEEIKNSVRKDEEIKYAARQLLHLLEEKEGEYQIIPYRFAWNEILTPNGYSINNDACIIATAYYNLGEDGVFVTDDLSCKCLAKIFNLNVISSKDYVKKDDEYLGFHIEQFDDDIQLAELYNNIIPGNRNNFNLIPNQYLLVKDSSGQVIDGYCWTDEHYEQIKYKIIESKMFGKIKPKDMYQQMAIHSLEHNQLTLLSGPPGSGKTMTGLGYLYQELEKGNIDRIIIFCNPVIARGAAKLGSIKRIRSK